MKTKAITGMFKRNTKIKFYVKLSVLYVKKHFRKAGSRCYLKSFK